jgi:hypothetical protein
MFLRLRLAAFLSLSLPVFAQSPATPARFRLVMPHEPGSILIDMTGGWQLDRVVLTNNGKRPIVQMHNDAIGIVASYILDHDPPYYETAEKCRDDALGTIMQGPLAKATVQDKRSDSLNLTDGQTLIIGSYLIAKQDGVAVQQENVFGFLTHDHSCATIHLSRTSFKSGEERLFYNTLKTFTYDPTYVATAADLALMAKLLPPDMAAAYNPNSTEAADAGPRKDPTQSADQSLTFSLADHPGYLHMDAPNFVITELSAKANGTEFGIRAVNKTISHAEVLGFLFLTDPIQPNAVACRDWMLKSEAKDNHGYRKVLGTHEQKSQSGVDLAVVDYEQSKTPAPFGAVRRFFVANNGLCADIEISGANSTMIEANASLLDTLVFDPARQPDFFAKFRYATVLFDHQMVAAAAPVYAESLALLHGVPEEQKWRRVATDQASMSYGMAGDLKTSRAINEAAIAKDPGYPLYYYNLACADAEAGDAAAARIHLQQASDRRANVLQGETFPDPARDDSILKLKKNAAFWAFVQSLPKN